MALSQLIAQQKKLTPAQLGKLVSQASSAPFSTDPLTVDEPLWGSFWQFDVLAPGSTLPADELALLRATRLDQSWPADTNLTQFLVDLHNAIAHPQASIWTTIVANHPCAIFTAPASHPPSAILHTLVVWFCATTKCLHAGYYTPFDPRQYVGMILQRSPDFAGRQNKAASPPPNWLVEVVPQHTANKNTSLAAQLDTAILQHRLAAGK